MACERGLAAAKRQVTFSRYIALTSPTIWPKLNLHLTASSTIIPVSEEQVLKAMFCDVTEPLIKNPLATSGIQRGAVKHISKGGGPTALYDSTWRPSIETAFLPLASQGVAKPNAIYWAIFQRRLKRTPSQAATPLRETPGVPKGGTFWMPSGT